MPVYDFMQNLQTVIAVMLGVTLVAFCLVAYYVCYIFDGE